MMCLRLEPKVLFCAFLCGLLLPRMGSQLIMGKQELQIVIKQTQVVFGQVIQTKCFDYTKVLVDFFCCSFAHKAWVIGLCLYEQVSFGKEFNFLFSLLQELVLIYEVSGWSQETVSSHV